MAFSHEDMGTIWYETEYILRHVEEHHDLDKSYRWLYRIRTERGIMDIKFEYTAEKDGDIWKKLDA